MRHCAERPRHSKNSCVCVCGSAGALRCLPRTRVPYRSHCFYLDKISHPVEDVQYLLHREDHVYVVTSFCRDALDFAESIDASFPWKVQPLLLAYTLARGLRIPLLNRRGAHVGRSSFSRAARKLLLLSALGVPRIPWRFTAPSIKGSIDLQPPQISGFPR